MSIVLILLVIGAVVLGFFLRARQGSQTGGLEIDTFSKEEAKSDD